MNFVGIAFGVLGKTLYEIWFRGNLSPIPNKFSFSALVVLTRPNIIDVELLWERAWSRPLHSLPECCFGSASLDSGINCLSEQVLATEIQFPWIKFTFDTN
jgi:hypothetical protein